MKLKLVSFCLLLLALLLIPQVVGLEVTSSTMVTGVGVINHEAEANTEVGYKGLKYLDSFYTRSLGYWNISEVNYTSEFTMTALGKLNSTINVDTGLELTNGRQMAFLRNYNINTGQSYYFNGDSSVVSYFAADNCSASFDLAQELSGIGGYKLMVLNESNSRVKEYLDKGSYTGDFKAIIISNYMGSCSYPASELDEDWLICP